MERKDEMNLTDAQEMIFEKYANKYGIDKTPAKDKIEKIEREKYVYKLLSMKGTDDTAIEKLLDLTIKDIELQYSMKQAIENKAGFMIALWGVLVASMIQNDILLLLFKNIVNTSLSIAIRVGNGIILGGLTIFGIVSLVYIILVLLYNPYSKFLFDRRDENFRCAVEDKNMLLVKLLDSNTTVWEKNEVANEKKYSCLMKHVIWMSLFVAFIILGFCCK